jgi:hypothetical protein
MEGGAFNSQRSRHRKLNPEISNLCQKKDLIPYFFSALVFSRQKEKYGVPEIFPEIGNWGIGNFPP